MDSKLETSLERILECPLCHEWMKDAVILHCGHAFCKHCLEGNITYGNNTCPCCRKYLNNSELRRVFTPGLIIKNIVDALSDNARPGPSRQKVICKEHPQNEMKYACERCRVPVCSECLIGDHWHYSSASRPKSIVKIEEELQLMVDRSEKWISDKKTYDSIFSRIKRKSDLASDAMAATQRQMEKAYEANLSHLKREKERLSATISKKQRRLVEKKKSMETENKEITKRANLISSDQSLIEDALKRKHPDDIISAYAVSKRFRDYLSNRIPSLSTDETELSYASSTYFLQSRTASSSLGEIRNKTLQSDDEDTSEDNDDYNEDDVDGNYSTSGEDLW